MSVFESRGDELFYLFRNTSFRVWNYTPTLKHSTHLSICVELENVKSVSKLTQRNVIHALSDNPFTKVRVKNLFYSGCDVCICICATVLHAFKLLGSCPWIGTSLYIFVNTFFIFMTILRVISLHENMVLTIHVHAKLTPSTLNCRWLWIEPDDVV